MIRVTARRAWRGLCSAVVATTLGFVQPAVALAQPAADASGTLNAVRARGSLVCAANTGLAGFGQPDNQGAWSGFDVDYCRAVAAAIFGDAGRARFVATTALTRFSVMQSGDADLLTRNTTFTLSRNTAVGMQFVATNFYDGQGFMVPTQLGLRSARDLEGATICVQTGTTTEQNLQDWARTNRITFSPVVIERLEEVVRAYLAGRCDALTSDISQLAAIRSGQVLPAAHFILPDVVSNEPLTIAVQQGDARFADVVRWTHFLLVAAEEFGVTRANVEELRRSDARPEVQRMLGGTGGLGSMLGLSDDWAVTVIKSVGNYGEMFARHLAPIGIQRGPNALWSTPGGLQYAPPFR